MKKWVVVFLVLILFVIVNFSNTKVLKLGNVSAEESDLDLLVGLSYRDSLHLDVERLNNHKYGLGLDLINTPIVKAPFSVLDKKENPGVKVVVKENPRENLTEKDVTVSQKVKQDKLEDVKEEVIVNSNIYYHNPNVSSIKAYTFKQKYAQEILNNIRNGINYIGIYYHDNSAEDFLVIDSAWEVLKRYYRSDYILQVNKNDEGYYYNLSDNDFNNVIANIPNAEAGEQRYKNAVLGLLNTLNLNTTDKDLINQIAQCIVNNFNYKVTNDPVMYSFTDSGLGQCHHFSTLFKDMCTSVGIECYFIEGYYNGVFHSWNRVALNGVSYYFDITLNEYFSNTSYSWVSEEEFRKTHSW